MNRNAQTLVEFAEQYTADRQCSGHYRFLLKHRATCLSRFSEKRLKTSELNSGLVNRWLVHLDQVEKKKPVTVDSYRRPIISLWIEAYRQRIIDEAPLRVRPVKIPPPVIRAYTLEEIHILLDAARKLEGAFPNGIERWRVLEALIRVAYETGLRRGDLLALQMDDLGPNGLIEIVQQKTNHVVRCQISEATHWALAAFEHPGGKAIPWPYRIDQLVRTFNRLKKAAGITRGSLKWIRRSAGTYAEKQERGSGHRLLGHTTDRVFKRNYEDRSITQPEPVRPPRL